LCFFELSCFVSENRRVTNASNNDISAETVMPTSQANCIAHIAAYSQNTDEAKPLGAN
jgi:hypothetical protein